jgi:hypothetical protein
MPDDKTPKVSVETPGTSTKSTKTRDPQEQAAKAYAVLNSGVMNMVPVFDASSASSLADFIDGLSTAQLIGGWDSMQTIAIAKSKCIGKAKEFFTDVNWKVIQDIPTFLEQFTSYFSATPSISKAEFYATRQKAGETVSAFKSRLERLAPALLAGMANLTAEEKEGAHKLYKIQLRDQFITGLRDSLKRALLVQVSEQTTVEDAFKIARRYESAEDQTNYKTVSVRAIEQEEDLTAPETKFKTQRTRSPSPHKVKLELLKEKAENEALKSILMLQSKYDASQKQHVQHDSPQPSSKPQVSKGTKRKMVRYASPKPKDENEEDKQKLQQWWKQTMEEILEGNLAKMSIRIDNAVKEACQSATDKYTSSLPKPSYTNRDSNYFQSPLQRPRSSNYEMGRQGMRPPPNYSSSPYRPTQNAGYRQTGSAIPRRSNPNYQPQSQVSNRAQPDTTPHRNFTPQHRVQSGNMSYPRQQQPTNQSNGRRQPAQNGTYKTQFRPQHLN